MTETVATPTVGGQNQYGVSVNVPYSPGNTTPQVSPDTQAASPAVISNQGAIDKATTNINSVNTMSASRGMVSDGTTTKYANGTIVQDNYQDPILPPNTSPIYGSVNGQSNRIVGYNTPGNTGGQTSTYFDSNSSTPAETPEEKQFNDLATATMAKTDANTATSIANIQSQFNVLRDQQKQLNTAQEAKTQNALLTGGVTGQGSSSQYVPISSDQIVTAQMNYGLQQIASLDAKEADLINQAKIAGDTQNHQVVDQMLAQIEKIRAEKAQATQKVTEQLNTANEKAREDKLQVTKDNAIADLYSQKITDPSQILKTLNSQGFTVTADDVAKTLKNIAVSTGLGDVSKLSQSTQEFYKMKEDNQLPAYINKLATDSEKLNAYLRDKAVAEKVPTVKTGPVGTAAERTQKALDQFGNAFVPGAKLPNGTPVVDKNGFITPDAWKLAIADAPHEGISRSSFIKQFGNMIFSDNAKAYGLTPVEVKLVTRALGQ